VGTPVRVGIIGCGGIAQMMHLPTLVERPDLWSVVALADVSRRTVDAVGARYGVSALFTDFKQLVARPEVDAVLVATSGSHRDAAIAALQAGKHLFVEKPLGFSLEEVQAIAEVARSSKGRLMVGYHKRFDPHYLKAREEVRSMKDLRYVEVTVLHPDDAAYRTHHVVLPLPETPWTNAPEDDTTQELIKAANHGPLAACVSETLGGQSTEARRVGAFLLTISLIHDIDAVRGILGEPEGVRYAEVWRNGMAQSSLTRFRNDVRVAMSWVSLPGLKHYEERLRFVGPEKRVTLTFPSPYLRHFPTALEVETMRGGELVVARSTVSYDEAFRDELHHFHRCLSEGRDPAPSIDDALGDARWVREIARAY
jgi:predicted dehydrogenase